MMHDNITRLCPLCGLAMPLQRCPNDGVKMTEPTWVHAVVQQRPAGTVIGARYVVSEELAIGSSSRIYLARDTVTARLVTLKLMALAAGTANQPTVADFVEQARRTAGLTSSHTVRLYDIGDDQGTPWLVFEHLDGIMVDSMLEKMRKKHRKLSPGACAELAAGVLRSLAEAHEIDIVHRNVTPSHIVLARTGCGELSVKLLGFNTVSKDGGQRIRDGIVGTPAFVSPEQVQKEPVDGRSDLYALGVVLYRCLSGKLPFVAREADTVMQMHVSEEPEPLAPIGDHGAAMARFVHRLLAKKPAARQRTALDALVTLQAITGRRLHAVPHLASLDEELDEGFGDHLVDSSGNPNDFLDAKTNVYGLAPIARVGPAKESEPR